MSDPYFLLTALMIEAVLTIGFVLAGNALG
jgi:hypothetical protein